MKQFGHLIMMSYRLIGFDGGRSTYVDVTFSAATFFKGRGDFRHS
jgi:hypothetical protein